jgi:multidrug efflux pump subunit AcrA (membrane-fusion protein)
MFATVEIPTEQTTEILAIPTTAIQRINDRPVVFVKRSETEFEQREVVPGMEASGWTEIRRGLEAGQSVITTGSFYAKTAALRELIGDEH